MSVLYHVYMRIETLKSVIILDNNTTYMSILSLAYHEKLNNLPYIKRVVMFELNLPNGPADFFI